MILIGEKLNSSIPSTMTILENHDEAAVITLIEKQEIAGSEFLDVNTSMCQNELETLLWVIKLIQQSSNIGIMIDTADTNVMTKAVEAASQSNLILNSATIDERFYEVTELAKKYRASIVALPISLEGQAFTIEEHCENIDLIIKKMRAVDITDEQIYLDVLAQTLATDGNNARLAINAIEYVSKNYPNVKTTCGLSNISFGLPKRSLINCAFISAAVFAGLSSAILDATNTALHNALAASMVIAGKDDFCMNYITTLREQDAF